MDLIATPQAPLAVLWMDTAYRLATILLGSENRARAKEKKPPLVPSMTDMKNSMSYIGSFETHFCEAVDDKDGNPQWVPGNQANLRSIQFNMFQELTNNLLKHAEALKGVKLGETAAGIMKERQEGEIYLPDTSGPPMDDFAQPVASKIAFYAFRLISIIRSNGGSLEFAPKTGATMNDILNIRSIKIQDIEEIRDDPVEIDNLDTDWGLDADIGDDTARKLKPRDIYNLSGKELTDALEAHKALEAWFTVYDTIEDNNETLAEEIQYQVDLAKEWVAQNRKGQHTPVTGTVKKEAQG